MLSGVHVARFLAFGISALSAWQIVKTGEEEQTGKGMSWIQEEICARLRMIVDTKVSYDMIDV